MFRLLKLMAYGLLGYAIYEFVRGAFGGEIEQMVGRMQDQMQGGGSQGSGGGSSNLHRDAARANMTGPGEGDVEDTQDNDGGSVRHAVGRGVVS
jgi:hypothetical protein